MKPVPKGFVACCWLMAIGFSVLTGMQARDPDATHIAILLAAALGSAVLPTRSVVGVTAVILGLAAVVCAGYLAYPMASWHLWANGLGLGPLLAAGAWLIVGGGFRALRT